MALVVYPCIHFKAKRLFHRNGFGRRFQVVKRLPGLPANTEHVFKAGIGNERRCYAFSFQGSVSGNGATVNNNGRTRGHGLVDSQFIDAL